mgnify:CR=1 FL=1
MVIRQINDRFIAMLQHGMQKNESPFEILYSTIEDYGSGYARTNGWIYYLDMNFYSQVSYELECHVAAPHIVTGFNHEISLTKI